MSEQDVLSTWLTTPEACARLGISERTLDRKVAARQIERRNRPAEGRRPIPVHNPEDIERLMMREPTVHIDEEISPPPGAIMARSSELTLKSGAIALLEQIVTAGRRSPRPWMTIAEASDYSGLSKAALRRLVRDGALPGLRDGATKVRKADLDELATGDYPMRAMAAEN